MSVLDAYPFGLKTETTSGAQVIVSEEGVWRLLVPPAKKTYRLAQLDDYHHLHRKDFLWNSPASLTLRLRASAQNLPGTWGFGLWNDPFGMGILLDERRVRLPALPNAAWFFYASPPNNLTLDDAQPGQGWTAGVFRSPRVPPALLLLGAPFLVLLAVRPLRRLLRHAGARIVRQAGSALDLDVCEWHTYQIDWERSKTSFFVDGVRVLETQLSPHGPLGVVIWIDNQYMYFTREGALGFGILDAGESGWIELADLEFRDRVRDGDQI